MSRKQIVMEIDLGEYGKLDISEDPSDEYYKYSGEKQIDTKYISNFEMLIFTNTLSDGFVEYIRKIFDGLGELIASSLERIDKDQAPFFDEYIEEWVEFIERENNTHEFTPGIRSSGKSISEYLRSQLRVNGAIISTDRHGCYRLKLDFVLGDHIVFTENLLTIEYDENLNFVEMYSDG